MRNFYSKNTFSETNNCNFFMISCQGFHETSYNRSLDNFVVVRKIRKYKHIRKKDIFEIKKYQQALVPENFMP